VQLGVIYVDGDWFFIEPLDSASSNVSVSGRDDNEQLLAEHVIYPRNATDQSPPSQHSCHVHG